MFSDFVIWYLFLAGTGAGAFVWAAIDDVRTNPDGDIRFASTSAYVGFLGGTVCLAVAALLLFLDLGNPRNIAYLFESPVRSLVSAGAWIIGIGLAVSASVSVLLIFHPDAPRLFRGLEFVGSLFGVGVMDYTGLLLSSMTAIDLWNTPLLIVLFIVSSLNCGRAFIVFGAFLLEGGTRRMSDFMDATRMFAMLEAIVLVAFLASRWIRGDAARQSCLMLFQGDIAGLFWGGLVVIGIAMPIAAEALGRIAPAPSLELVDAGATLAGGACLRYCIVLAGAYSAIVTVAS